MIEFENTNEANNAINSSVFTKDNTGVPVRSPFLWFRAGSQKVKKSKLKSTTDEQRLTIEDGIHPPSSDEVYSLLRTAESLDDQIMILHRITCLNDLETRLRFLVARQMEMSLTGIFPNLRVYPFGSSVNGFGRHGCDLDLILRLASSDTVDSNNSRLVFHTKETLTNGRSQIQRHMECLSDVLQLFLPGVCHVRRILQARVPIIKFQHEHMNLEVDLSMSNMTGVYMSELLYMFGEMDTRVRPLIFTIRKWAQTVGITNPSPGRWISNFSLSVLVLFFLQQLPQPILPTISYLMKNANAEDVKITDDHINCTFLRDLTKLNFTTTNKDTISTILLQFFEFYSKFDFTGKSISLIDGRSHQKPDHSPIFIVNPFEVNLNISKNVSLEETERLRIEIRNAAWILESDELNQPNSDTQAIINWGLLNLFKINRKKIVRPQMFFKPRMVDVKELFVEQEQEEGVAGVEGVTLNTTVIEFKNNLIRNQIDDVKRQTRIDLKQLKEESYVGGAPQQKTHRSRRKR